MEQGEREQDKGAPPSFQIFRKGDAPHLHETGAMVMGEMAPVTAEGVIRWVGAGGGGRQ